MATENKIKGPVRGDPHNENWINQADGTWLGTIFYPNLCPEVIHRLNGYDVAVEALWMIRKHLEILIPRSTDLISVGMIASQALKDLGELDEQS